ncbi:Hypothetical protein D9617_12g037980 [Elsinoe fawcettii]|nr:Hypothetical protein D9617_12g037980 [Elsinoe fawcettii]
MATTMRAPSAVKFTFSEDDEGTEVEPAMAVAGGPGGLFHTPIHESLTLSALTNVANSGVARDTTLNSADNATWEFVRGVIWNDDPAGLLFNDSYGTNHSYASGAQWVAKYKMGASDWNPRELSGDRFYNVTGRSHYGDMQFLHCMASAAGEYPEQTKSRVMIWMEVMYKLSTGEIGPHTLVKDTKLGDLLASPPDVAGGSVPPRFQPLSYMLAPKSEFSALDFRRRALGSMFHVIQDSYAIGHAQRVPLNKQDQASTGKLFHVFQNCSKLERPVIKIMVDQVGLTEIIDPLTYKPGTIDRWGAILNFHTYFGQNDSQHAHYDHPSDGIPDPGNLSNLDQWNGLLGCGDAVDKCVALGTMWSTGRSWDGDDGVQRFLDQDVFPIDKDATPANDHVL